MTRPLVRAASRVAVSGCMMAVLTLTADPAAGQRIRGSVVDSARKAVPVARVEARTTAGVELPPVETDSLGRFTFLLPAAGTYVLQVILPGSAATAPSMVTVRQDEEVVVVMRTDVQALRLSALDVTTRRRMPMGREAVYRRIEQMKTSGVGRAVTRDELDRMNPQSIGIALSRISGRVRLVESNQPNMNTIYFSGASGARGGCAPAIFLDGHRINFRPYNVNTLIEPHRVDAIELYFGGGHAPIGFHDQTGCGSILIWSRSQPDDETSNKPSQLRRWVTAGVAITAGVLLLARN
jgi:hypothetical protein